MNRITEAFQKIVPETVMTEEETKLFINILMSKDENLMIDINKIDKETEFYKNFKPVINSFLSQVLLKRLEVNTSIKMSLGGLLMLLHHIENPGESVMYAYYLHIMLSPGTVFDVTHLANLFPLGFFSSEQLNTIWDVQKIQPSDEINSLMDNLLDFKKTWSIDN